MARRSGGGGRSAARPAHRRSPAPQTVNRAPPPAPAQSGGGGGGIGSTIAEAMAFGAASSVGHRAVDSIIGPRTIQIENVGTMAATAGAPTPSADACNVHTKAFADCVNNFGSDISKCQLYMDMLAECRKNSSMSI